MKFTELDLQEDLLKSIQEAGYDETMPVQEAVFAHSFKGEDIYAQSQTGSGKTAAFLITIFKRMLTESSLRMKKSLIIAPTRELAVQIEDEAKKLSKYLNIEIGSFYGGVGYADQLDMLRNNVKLIIGTPGRIIDLVKQGKMLLKDVGFLVIDEADRMFDMGFIDDLRLLLRYLPEPKDRQTLLFSATLNVRVKNLAWDYMIDPTEIAIEPENVTVETITQELYHVGSDEKVKFLLGVLQRENPESAIIFCNLKRTVEEVAKRLKINGYDCEYIMGDLPQKSRLKIIDSFKEGKLRFLVATDVAARGLDVDSLAMVINFDLPMEAENYIHRIGRTARAGKSGKAISLACEKYVYGLSAIEKYVNIKLPVLPVDDSMFGADKSAGMRMHRDHHDVPNRGPHSDRDKNRQSDRKSLANRRSVQHSIRELTGAEPSDSTPKPSRPAQNPRSGQGNRNGTPNPNRDNRQGQRPQQGRQNPQSQPTPQRDLPQSGGRDPYAVPMEERMKRYREKYGQTQEGPGSPDSGRPRQQGQGKGAGQRQDGRKPGQGKPPARNDGKPRQGEPQKKGAHENAKRTHDKEHRARENARAAQPIPAPVPPKKNGIIGKILGLFGKKE